VLAMMQRSFSKDSSTHEVKTLVGNAIFYSVSLVHGYAVTMLNRQNSLCCLQSNNAGRCQVLGPKPERLLDDTAPGAGAADRPVGLGEPYRGRAWHGDVGSYRSAVCEHSHVHQLFTHQFRSSQRMYVVTSV